MLDLSLSHEHTKVPSRTLSTYHANQTSASGSMQPDTEIAIHTSPPLEATEVMLETLLMNLTLRKQFAYYAMTGNATNLVWITRTNFIKFVKDCKLDLLTTPALKDVDITNIFAAATGTGKAMNFAQLLSACILIFKRSQHLQVGVSSWLGRTQL
ncbi:hypothetical protein DVH05_015967 [Phytophthora capsici]|nr:hypothetical protein DVH05_015967 [Phytophthora capsici]